MITVANQQLVVDVLEELEPYMEQFDKAVVREDKLQSCSPFREDRHPSFAVNLENGAWIDSGSTDDYHKGHFIQLLSFLRQENTEDTVAYLLEKYSLVKIETDTLCLDMSFLHPAPKPKIFFTEDLQPYAFRHPYLSTRGITEDVQKAFRIGYDKESHAVVMPWADKYGHIVNIKFRSVIDKKFWYAKGGQKVKGHLYGLNVAERNACKEVWLCESEIDCMRLWSEGIPAIAFGTANMSKAQEKLLLNSQIESAVIAVDNDKAGKKFKQNLIDRLIGKLELKYIEFPSDEIKDISDMTGEQIKSCAESTRNAGIKLNI